MTPQQALDIATAYLRDHAREFGAESLEDYSLEYEGPDDSGDVIAEAIHRDDATTVEIGSGCGKSRALAIDPRSGVVTPYRWQ
jgi:hypothetical protein